MGIKDNNWHALEADEVLGILKTSKQGLDNEQVKKRAQKYGPNRLPGKKTLSPWLIFLYQFKSPLIYILIAAGFISLFLKHYIDAGIIFVAVLLNTIIGFIQENKANNTLNKLKSFFVPVCIVIREGKSREIPASELVPGDIAMIKNGDVVPADLRIIELENLEIIESVLTGESEAIEKNLSASKVGSPLGDRKSMAFLGTSVSRGEAVGVVVEIGADTEFGKIAKLLSEMREEETPLQSRLNSLSKNLGIIISIISAVIILFGYLVAQYDFFQIFITGVAIAVAAIPEGLPIAISVILVIGMQYILDRGSLVRRLSATETLGSVSAICTDKTGTLTEGEMRVSRIYFHDYKIGAHEDTAAREDPELMVSALRIGMLCNDAIVEDMAGLEEQKISGSPTEKALMYAGIQAGLDPAQQLKEFPKLKEIPFDSASKYMATLHRVLENNHFFKSKYALFVKGAPEVVMQRCEFIHDGKTIRKFSEKEEALSRIDQLALEGFRIITLAYRNIDEFDSGMNSGGLFDELTFVAFVVLRDPIRPDARKTIALCQESGIRAIIITGDHKHTAMAIAKMAGIRASEITVVEGSRMDNLDDRELAYLLKSTNVFARISPQHKLRIVNALKKNGEVVAMVGDGVNDSPAIKAADIGIALGSGSEVTKESADIILLDNNFSTIVAAIEQGRIIFSNIRKVTTFLLSDSFSEIVLIFGSMLFGLPLALLPGQILWLNIVNDGFPNFSLAYERGEADIMRQKPIKRNEPILNRDMKIIIFGLGLIRDIFIFGLFYWLLSAGHDINYIRTAIFGLLGVKSLLSIFSIRNFRKQVWSINPFSNLYLVGSVILSFILIILVIYWPPLSTILSTTPLDSYAWVLIISGSIFSLLLLEIFKYYFIINKRGNSKI